MAIPRVDVLGVKISVIDMRAAVDEIERWITQGERQYVCVTGVHGVMESQRDPELLAIHNGSGLTTPDGMPMVWCGRWAGAPHMTRVYGPDLILAAATKGADLGWRMFFYGAAPGVPEKLAQRLGTHAPGLPVAGCLSPPYRALTDSDVASVADTINQSNADIVWVGLSTPKQERWMAQFRPLLSAPVLIGVGAAFDIHAGNLPQAPLWMQRSGLEWLYRLGREPRRLWKRYLTNNPRFVVSVMRRPPRLTND